jgi:hypothetical protein
MSKLLKYVIGIALILVAIFAIFKFTNKGKSEEVADKEEVPKKVFEEPQYMIYMVNDKEKYKLTKEDKEYSEILDKLNSSIDENYNSKRETLPLDILDIHKEIYSKNSVLRLHYSDEYEIDIIFEKNSVLDIIYVEDGRTSCFSGFDNKVQEEIKEYLDNISK